jgi:hypothetical protein
VNGVVYLIGLVLLIAVGSGVLWFVRRRPRVGDDPMTRFQRELRALDPQHGGGGDPG